MAKVEAAVREKFAAMEPRERRETSNAWRKADRTKKEQMLEEMDIDVPLGVPTPLTLAFDKLKFKNGAECIDALLGRFLVTPVSQVQRTALLEALGIKNPKAKLSVEDVSFASRQAVIHLITSMAEYQLC